MTPKGVAGWGALVAAGATALLAVLAARFVTGGLVVPARNA